MLVIGGIEDAGREQHDGRIARGGRRRDRFQRFQKLVRIILDRRDAVAREQLGKKPQHDLAVLQHVGDAGRRARIVLEHVEAVGVDAHDVDAGNVHVDVVRDLLAVHLRAENRILEDQILGYDSGLEDLPAAIDVLDVGVDRLDPLRQAALQEVPFGGRDDAGNDVEGDEALLRLRVAIDGKGDADAAEEQLRLAPAEIEHVRLDRAEPLRQLGIGRPHRVSAAPHLVEHVVLGPHRRAFPRQTPASASNLCAKLGGAGRGCRLTGPPLLLTF